ncbi:MAG: hypothetical protein OES34_12220 [Nitrosopumilus sp.]|nr:hypothetical protein [Nitrosopumilus sp.]
MVEKDDVLIMKVYDYDTNECLSEEHISIKKGQRLSYEIYADDGGIIER